MTGWYVTTDLLVSAGDRLETGTCGRAGVAPVSARLPPPPRRFAGVFSHRNGAAVPLVAACRGKSEAGDCALHAGSTQRVERWGLLTGSEWLILVR